MDQSWFSFNDSLDITLDSWPNSTASETTTFDLTNLQSVTTMLSWSEVALVILYCSIIAGTVIGNTLVIAAVVTTRRLRTVTNCFVMSLAMADWLVGMFVMPVKVVYHLTLNKWTLGWLVCKIWIALDVMLCTSSILSLCIISIDRYLAITRPLAYSRKRRSKRLALGMISCVWVGSVAITTPPMFKWLHSEQPRLDQCDYEDDPFYVVYSALGSFFVPLLVMLYVYARIACVIARRQSSIQKAHSSKDKDCGTGGDELGLTLNRISSDTKSDPRPKEDLTSVTSKFTFFKKVQSSKNSRRSLPSCRCFRTPWRHKRDRESQQGRRLATSLEEGESPNEMPSKSLLAASHHLHSNQSADHMASSNFVSTTGNGNSFRLLSKTGSRLCDHHVTNSSPPISTVLRHNQPSSSAATRLARMTGPESMDLLPPRVWTVDFQRQHDLDRERHLVKSSITLNNGTCRTCVEQSTDGAQCSSLQVCTTRETGLRRHFGKIQSASCSALTGVTARWSSPPAQVVRSKSVKAMVIHQLSDNPSNRPLSSSRMTSFKRETKTAQTLAAVVGGFIICWLPFFLAYVIGPFQLPENRVSAPLMEFFVWLGWGNSAINPAIYAFYNPDFRSAFWRLTFHKCNGLLKVNRRKHQRSGESGKRYERKEDQHLQNNDY